jgi:very-short-patch-repair endonuclease
MGSMEGQSSCFAKHRAIELRRTSTEAERLLWYRLRRGHLGTRFRRQHPFEKYILDFVSTERRLVIEWDGSQHIDNENENDCERTALLENAGFRVLRFWNDQVLTQTDAVLEVILLALNPSPPQPSP